MASGGNRGALAAPPAKSAPKPAPKANPNSLDSQASAIANAQTQGPISELAAQIARNNTQGQAAEQQTFGYYMQLAKQAQDSVNQTKSIGSDLNNTLTGNAWQTAGALQGFGQNAAGGALAHMGSLGLDGGGLANVQAETARQQGIGQLNAGVFRDSGATQGANYASNAASNLGTYALRGQERLGDIARATRLSNVPLSDKQAALIASKGALKANALGKLTQQDFTNKVTLAGLGLKQSQLGITAQNNAANQKIKVAAIKATLNGQQLAQMRSDRTFRLDQQKFGAAQAQQNYMRTHGLGPYKPPAASRGSGSKPKAAKSPAAMINEISKVQSTIAQLKGSKVSDAQVRQVLTTGLKKGGANYAAALGGGNGPIANAAFDLYVYHYLSPGDVRALKGLGFDPTGHFPTSPPKKATGVLGGNLFGVPV